MTTELNNLILHDKILNTDPNGVLISIERKDNFYEGKYLSNIKFNPSKPGLIAKLGLWLINSGYLHNIKKHFAENSILIEFGCAGGVDYLGSHYKMIGMDISLSSLQYIADKYSLCIQCDITKAIPLKDNSVDGIVSSFFWEHMDTENKKKILNECFRVLKPNGKMVLLFDVENNNILVKTLKKKNLKLYQQQFIDQDGHWGYDTVINNTKLFEENRFALIKKIGYEKTFFQSRSVYTKMKEFGGYTSILGNIGTFLSGGIFNYPYLFFLRSLDSIFNFLPDNKARFIMTIVKKMN